MTARRGRAALLAAVGAAALVLLALSGSSPARGGPGAASPRSRLAKRFPHSVVLRPPPPERHKTSAGTVTVSPSAIPAGATGQRITVTLSPRRGRRAARFGVRLPSRWRHPKGNTPYVAAVRGRGSGRISLEGLNPPAGTYMLGLLYGSRVVGHSQVRVYGRTRLPTVVGKGAVPARAARSQGRAVQQFGFGSDPAVAFDQNGNGWYSSLVITDDESASRVVVNRIPSTATSASGFQANNTGLPLRGNSDFADKEMIATDRFAGSPHFGRIYVVWNENKPSGAQNVVMSFCDTVPNGSAFCDDPNHWSPVVQVSDGGGGSFINADVAAAPNGDVYVVWWNVGDNRIDGDKCAAASNCASSNGWGTDVNIRSLNNDNVDGFPGGDPIPFFCPITAAPAGRVSPIPSVDVSGASGNSGRVFVAVSDIRSGSGTTRCIDDADGGADYIPNPVTDETWDVFAGTALNALPTGGTLTTATGNQAGDNFLPWLGVDQSTGTAETAFYETSGDATRATTHYSRAPLSTLGSPTTAPTQLAAAASDYSGANTTGFDYGDYEQVSAANGKSYPIWTDHRAPGLTGQGEVVFRKLTLPSTLAAEQNLTAGSPEGAETAIETSGSGSTTRILAGSNNMIDAPMLAWLSTNDGTSFSGPVSLPLNAALQTISVGNAAPVTEGNSGSRNATFRVSLSGPARGPVTVRATTGGGTATAGSDYAPVSTIVSFATGQSSKTVTVPVLGDGGREANETFQLRLSSASGALISHATGVGTIIDDDPVRDVVAPLIKLTIGKQRLLRRKALIFKFRSNERVRATFSARIGVPGASRTFRIKRVKKTIRSNHRTRIKIKVSRRVRRAIRRALLRHRKVTARISVTAVDAAGNKSKKSKKLRIRR